MSSFFSALSASIVSSIGGLGGGALLLAHERLAKTLSRYLMSFGAGAILGVCFLDLLPEAMKILPSPTTALRYVFLGIVIFFLIERAIASMHRHQDDAEEASEQPQLNTSLHRARSLVIIGDSIHNFLDGIVVAVAFLIGPGIGITTAVSILLHELPHEIADFSILIHSGMERRRVWWLNFWSALVAPVGTILGYFFLTRVTSIQAPLLAIAAGNLLYLTLADLVPHLHHERRAKIVLAQVALFLLGTVILFLLPHESV